MSIVSGEFDDKHDEFQTTFMSLNSWMNNQLGSFRDNKPTDLSPQDLKALYLEFEKELLDRVENKLITDSLPDLLADCLKYSASYSIYNDLIKLGRTLETPMERQAFYSFITDSIAFNEKALICSDYNSFHNAYRFNVESSPGVYLEPKERTREQFRLEITTKELEQNLKTRNGIWAEFLAASTMYTTGFLEEEIDQHVITTYSTLIEENFKEPYIRQLLLTKCDETSEKVAGIRNLKIPKKAKLNQYDSLSGSDLLEKIMKDNQGKFVYIDIWATWCSPCKRQIPHSIQMQERYPEVEFIYLCCRSAKDTWHNVIKQYQLNGTHILLTDEQYEFLYEHFSLSGVPHYILINKEGKVVFNDNPGCKTEQVLEIKLEQLTNN